MTFKQQFILGIDAGTHGIRVLLLRLPDYKVVSKSYSSYSRNCSKGHQEMVVADLLDAFCEAVDRISIPSGARVLSIGITHQRGTIIPVDAFISPISNFICDSDERAIGVEGFVENGIDPHLYYQKSGCPILSFNGLAKIFWIRKMQPDIFNNAIAWLSPQDYLLSVMADEIMLSEGSALRNGILDITTRKIWKELIPGAPFLSLPLVPLGNSCAEVSSKWTERWPFLRKTKLVAVPGDQPSALVGSGAKIGTIVMNLGTSFVASIHSNEPIAGSEAIITNEILPDKRFAPEFGTGAGGQFIDFITELFFNTTRVHWRQINDEIAKIEIGSQELRILPLLWKATSKRLGRIDNLQPFHKRAHFFRSAFEGLAMEARISIEKLSSFTGATNSIRVFGGLSRNNQFLQILSSVLGLAIEVASQQEASAFGAGLCSACALENNLSFDEILRIAETPRAIIYPNKEDHILYEQLFQKYISWR